MSLSVYAAELSRRAAANQEALSPLDFCLSLSQIRLSLTLGL